MIEHYATNDQASNPAWIDECRVMQSEGSITPAHVDIRIEHGRFSLIANGEVIGTSSQYKAVRFARQLLLAELGQVRS